MQGSRHELKVTSEKQVYKYWLKKLPEDGWTIVKSKSKDDEGVTEFKGHGYGDGGKTGIEIDQRKAAVAFHKKRKPEPFKHRRE